MVGGIVVGIAWVMNWFADSLVLLYVGAAIGGIGAARSTARAWATLSSFPDRRSLAAGLTAAGFGRAQP
jgi:OFA family oxalate/formate antiporter-like MFS transporter